MSKITEIRLVETQEEKEALYYFRYHIYTKEMGLNPPYADHLNQTLFEPIFDEYGYNFAAFNRGQIVGTIRSNHSKASRIEYYPSLCKMESVGSFHPQHTSITTKLMISQEYRSTILAVRLALAVCELDVKSRIRYDFILCQPTPKLVDFYLRLGYKIHQKLVYHPYNGERVCLMIDFEDFQHLKNIRSPLLRAKL
jgi:hypothetical protein